MEGATVESLLWGLVRKDGQAGIGLEVIERKLSGVRVLHTNDDAAGFLKATHDLRRHPVHEWYIEGDKIVIDIGSCKNQGIKYVGGSHVYYCGLRFVTEVREGAVCCVYKPCDPDNCPLADKEHWRAKE